MDRNQLTNDVARQLGNRDAVLSRSGVQVVGVSLAGRRLFDVDEGRHPSRDLHTLVPQVGRPLADVIERVERRLVARKLGEENRRALDRFHDALPMDRLGPPALMYVNNCGDTCRQRPNCQAAAPLELGSKVPASWTTESASAAGSYRLAQKR